MACHHAPRGGRRAATLELPVTAATIHTGHVWVETETSTHEHDTLEVRSPGEPVAGVELVATGGGVQLASLWFTPTDARDLVAALVDAGVTGDRVTGT